MPTPCIRRATLLSAVFPANRMPRSTVMTVAGEMFALYDLPLHLHNLEQWQQFSARVAV